MRKDPRTCFLLALVSAGLFACGNNQVEPQWDCSTSQVPNGKVTNCLATALTLADGTYTGCPLDAYGTPVCPPGETHDGPPADTGAGGSAGSTDKSGSGASTGTAGRGDTAGAPGSAGAGSGDTHDGNGTAGSTGLGGNSSGAAGNTGVGGDGTAGGTAGGDVPGVGGGVPGGGGGDTHDGSGDTGAGGKRDKDKGEKGNAGTPNAGDSGMGGGTPGTAGSAGGAGSGGSGGEVGWQCVVQSGVVECRKTDCVPGNQELLCGACVPTPDYVAYDDCLPPDTGGCWVTGGGYVVDADGDDSFGGNGMPMKDGRIRGEWEHVDHGTGNKLHGQVSYLYCRHVDEPGPGQPSGPKHNFDINQAYYGGPARWFSNGAWADGYWFDIMAEDHGEPGNKPGPGKHGSAGPDFYHLRVLQLQGGNQSGTLIYETQGDFEGGNFQIHPPNGGHPYTSASLPTWVELQP